MVSDTIQFLFTNKIYKIKNPDPNKTILNYIRNDLKLTGTKEGCAEGGCGACTIVLGELNKNKIIYKSINACISFLPTLNGKQLILIEDLVHENKPHMVQEAMVNFHGSQCGFCTPGFTMSLFSMQKNNKLINNEIIEEALSGNLCRCTGYRPIIDAAKSLNNKKDNDEFRSNENKVINLLKKINNEIEISYRNKKFYSPKSLSSLKKIIRKNPNSKFLSGGTDLSLEVTKMRGEINTIINLNLVKELKFVKKNKNFLEVGAGISLYDFQNIIKSYYSDFYAILKRYGSVQIRNVGTIAGNIATASPIGDTLPLLLSLDAKVVVQKISKKTILPLKNFFVSYRKTKLKKGQFIHSIIIPIFKKNIFKAYKISKRIDDDISSVCASFNLEINNKKIKNIKIAYGGMASIPKRAINCEKTLINTNISEENIEKTKKTLEKDFKPISDMRASKNYRMEIAKNLLMKCLMEIKDNKLLRLN